MVVTYKGEMGAQNYPKWFLITSRLLSYRSRDPRPFEEESHRRNHSSWFLVPSLHRAKEVRGVGSILNLKPLNEFIPSQHFRMKSIKQSVHGDKVYRFQVLYFGMKLSPLVWTELTKAILKWARRQQELSFRHT
ncbi:hypothetical protein MUCCIDRAFT_107412 [Mucor lusitanicus CBS 277.49]|uniref:Uncharacterized protein n=1 Tax=Mucor lusitanicus CBS 277.49 TaxID=747725 RepID=A0A162QZ61_MUCCL|nr:hypothetical protein MUCCIDRAFT_107412 [Mucor lusitanicus CBS 277.49]